MDVSRWLDKVPALLHLYYPGQEGGTAVAQILFGQHNPEGKLPVSFDRSWDDEPLREVVLRRPQGQYHAHTIGEDGKPKDYTIEHIKYGDKLMVGYRYWTTTGKHPLFPFGYGLSYTTFSFSNLNAPASAAAGSTVSSQLRRHQHRQRSRSRSRPALRLRSLRQGRPPRARTEGLRQSPSRSRRNPARNAHPRRARLQLLGRAGAQMDHRSRQIHYSRRRLQRKHAAERRNRPALTAQFQGNRFGIVGAVSSICHH